MTVVTLGTAPRPAAAATLGERYWRMAAIALLSVRLIQGFIYWGGGSRRFIYDPEKLNPDAPSWMANKFQSAMPGALFGTDHLIAFLLHHFWLLYPAVILFSGAELIAGAALMAGLLTRLAALVSVGFSIVLMLMFGWQGGTCIDEWTMAGCNLAMGATLVLAGSGAYSLDNVLLDRNPRLSDRAWFRWLGGSLPLPLTDTAFRISGSRCWRWFWPSTSEPTAITAARLSRRTTAGRSARRGTTLRSVTALCCPMAASNSTSTSMAARPRRRPTS